MPATEAGKGSDRRPEDSKSYRSNYDLIKWPEPKADKPTKKIEDKQ